MLLLRLWLRGSVPGYGLARGVTWSGSSACPEGTRAVGHVCPRTRSRPAAKRVDSVAITKQCSLDETEENERGMNLSRASLAFSACCRNPGQITTLTLEYWYWVGSEVLAGSALLAPREVPMTRVRQKSRGHCPMHYHLLVCMSNSKLGGRTGPEAPPHLKGQRAGEWPGSLEAFLKPVGHCQCAEYAPNSKDRTQTGWGGQTSTGWLT